MPEAILVTGATGFIGSALCRSLLAREHPVRALHRRTSSLRSLEGLDLELVLGDVLDPASLVPAMRSIDWVFHTAAQAAYWRNPGEVRQAAIEGTRNVVTAAREAGVKRVILTSSLAAMGLPAPGKLLSEEDTFDLSPERFPYGYAKRQAELAALQACGESTQVVIVNPSVVLGPGDRNQISGSLIIEVASGRAPVWFQGGMNVVHLQDVVRGHLAAAERGQAGERYLLGGENLSHRTILTTVAEVVGRRPPRFKIPAWLIEPAARMVDVLARYLVLPLDANQVRMSRLHIYCDTSKARRELGLPEPIPFRKAVQDCYAWYRAEGLL